MILNVWTKIKRERGLYRYNPSGQYFARVLFHGKLVRLALEAKNNKGNEAFLRLSQKFPTRAGSRSSLPAEFMWRSPSSWPREMLLCGRAWERPGGANSSVNLR
jgi:hypothetical protein